MNTGKKEWDGIVSKVQTFVPQEYVASCWISITNLGSYNYFYIDKNKDNTYQSSERYYSGYNTSGRNKLYEGVSIYRSYQSDKPATESTHKPSDNTSYNGTYTYSNVTYKFALVTTCDVKTDSGGNAYYLPSGTTAS